MIQTISNHFRRSDKNETHMCIGHNWTEKSKNHRQKLFFRSKLGTVITPSKMTKGTSQLGVFHYSLGLQDTSGSNPKAFYHLKRLPR